MRIIEASRDAEYDPRKYVHRNALESDIKELIMEARLNYGSSCVGD